jgi:hypothetical protein
MKRIIRGLLLGCFTLMVSGHVQAESPREQLNQMIQKLQQNPNDNALREKIIRLVQTVKPVPVIPEDARRHEVIGTTLFKDAKTPDDYSQVTAEFEQAADLAPQWREARYNLALAKEAAGDYSGAVTDMKLYQLFKLPDEEARNAQDRIYVLEAKVAEAAKKKVSDATAQADQKIVDLQGNFPRLMQKLEGSTFVGSVGNSDYLDGELNFLRKPFNDDKNTVYGKAPYLEMQEMIVNFRGIHGFEHSYYVAPRVVVPISATSFWTSQVGGENDLWLKTVSQEIYTLSQDGLTLTYHYDYSGESQQRVATFTKKQ